MVTRVGSYSATVPPAVVLAPAPAGSAILYLVGDETVRARVIEFIDIEISHIDSTEPRAAELTGCLVNTRRALMTVRAGSDEYVDRIARSVFELETLLINCMDKEPLKIPVTCNSRIWEKWMLAHCRKVTKGIDPFSRRRFEDATPHLFATDLIRWIGTLFIATTNTNLRKLQTRIIELRATRPPKELVIDQEGAEAADDDEAKEGYFDIAEKMKFSAALFGTADNIGRCKEASEKATAATDEECKFEADATIEIIEETTREVGRNVTGLVGSHAVRENELKGAIADRDATIARLVIEKRAYLEELRELKRQFAELDARCTAAEVSIAQSRASIPSGGGGGCTIM